VKRLCLLSVCLQWDKESTSKIKEKENKKRRKTYNFNHASNGRRELNGLHKDKGSPCRQEGEEKSEDGGRSFHV
jgi:hypothetical protein